MANEKGGILQIALSALGTPNTGRNDLRDGLVRASLSVTLTAKPNGERGIQSAGCTLNDSLWEHRTGREAPMEILAGNDERSDGRVGI